MVSLVLFLSTFVGVNWLFCRSIFLGDDSNNDLLGDRDERATHDGSQV
jgi:hypothetical protein